MCFVVFSVECSSSRFEKKNDRAAADACWLACMTVQVVLVCGRADVVDFFLLLPAVLCADCLGTF